MILMKIGRRIARLVRFIENPMLLSLRRRGVPIDTFLELNQSWLINANINTVFDIGAHTGKFAIAIHEVLPAARIYSFEPLEDCYKQLKKRMEGINDFIALNIALNDTEGELEFYRNEYSQSSSSLPMTDLHKQSFPFATKEHPTKVRSAKLDDVAMDLEIEHNVLVKMDVQGLEDKVIAGGRNTIEQSAILIIETSFEPLYAKQPLFEDIYDSLKEDFRYMGALEHTKSPIDGRILFEDSIFVKK